ncbi:FtsX-like permease family protein [Actinospica robiniae]|uniref:FtsX-like permease family protein n=1 Tax=Actinospica robiniae TaxID=304901 RepID=UPI0003F8C024|nr:FtsX-like permease family protein [Actinospica robiniae]
MTAILRLGLRLTLDAGREALVRLVVVAAAVAVGVTVLLCVAADFHAYSTTTGRACWECTTGTSPSKVSPDGSAELWNYSTDDYQGRTIERLDVAVLGAGAPVLPGLTRMPSAGQYYASPAMRRLLDSVPAQELGNRYPGTFAGLIGDAALSSPDELVVVVGEPQPTIGAQDSTTAVTAIAHGSSVNVTAFGYRFGFGLVALALFVPLLVLIGVATRLAAARRETRYAAMRLVGATNGQIGVIASMETFAGAMAGALLGVAGFLVLRSTLARAAVTGLSYFPAVVTPTGWGYSAAVVGVPVCAALGAVWSLRRVRIDPLGVTRRGTPRPPRIWGPILLLLGLAVFIAVPGNSNTFPLTFLGMALMMVGLVVGGSWLTVRLGALVARTTSGPSTLLATRRLSDDPRAAARAVSGLVLAVFLGTAIAAIVPPLISTQNHVGGGTLSGVLRAGFSSQSTPGLSPQAGSELLAELGGYPGAKVLPLYVVPRADARSLPPGVKLPPGATITGGSGVACGGGGGCATSLSALSCAQLSALPALGSCPVGAVDVEGDFAKVLLEDNMLSISQDLPVVTAHSTSGTYPLSTLRLGTVLVQTTDPATMERVRTLLTPYSRQVGASTPVTFGEVAGSRAVLYNEAQHGAIAVTAVILLVAACSLAVSVAGGVLERKRPFTLLRLTGTPVSALYKVALIESAVPLLGAAVLAGAAGLLVAMRVVRQLGATGTSIALPDLTYALAVGGGLVFSLALVCASLPLLRHVTDPDSVRFE